MKNYSQPMVPGSLTKDFEGFFKKSRQAAGYIFSTAKNAIAESKQARPFFYVETEQFQTERFDANAAFSQLVRQANL